MGICHGDIAALMVDAKPDTPGASVQSEIAQFTALKQLQLVSPGIDGIIFRAT